MYFLTSTAAFLTSTSKFGVRQKSGHDHSLTSSKKIVDAVANVKPAEARAVFQRPSLCEQRPQYPAPGCLPRTLLLVN